SAVTRSPVLRNEPAASSAPGLDRDRIIAAAIPDLRGHDHGLLDAVIDIETVAIAAGSPDRIDVLRHKREILASELLFRLEWKGIVLAVERRNLHAHQCRR